MSVNPSDMVVQELAAGALCFDGGIINAADQRCAPECPVKIEDPSVPVCGAGETRGVVCYPHICGTKMQQCVAGQEVIQVRTVLAWEYGA